MITTLRPVVAHFQSGGFRSHARIHSLLTPCASHAVLIVGGPSLQAAINGRCPISPRSGTATP